MKIAILLLFPVFLIFPAVLEAQEIDLSLLKQDTRIFEGIVREILRQNFPSPFALTGEAEGTYLHDYGIVVSFHLNINRAEIRTPFGLVPTRTGEQRSKEEQLKVLKESMVRGLADYGSAFKQLAGQNRISIIGHVEDRAVVDPAGNKVIIVISVSKEEVDMLATGKISRPEFERRVHVLQY